MSWTYTDEYYKRYTKDTWNESAGTYASVRRNLDKFNGELVRAAAPRPDERVLDVACGDGEPAMTLAPFVAPGSVVGIDLAENMVEMARSRAKEARLHNARFDVMDAEKLDFPNHSFDLVTCRFGLQIVTDPEEAIAEMHRVLKPGGRITATVWGPGDRVPAIHAIIGPMLEFAEPDESGYLPTPYEMGGEGELVELLLKVGFEAAREVRVSHPWTFRDEEDYLTSTLSGTPIGHSLKEEDEKVQAEVLRKTRENLRAWKRPDGSLSLPAEAVVVSAVKPA